MHAMKRITIAGAIVIAGLNVGAARYTDPGACLADDAAFTSTNGGCRDNASGLTWSAAAYTETSQYRTWDSAMSYCSNLVEGSQSDWRAPTKTELEALVAHNGYGHVNNADPLNPPAIRPPTSMWSSTIKGKPYAWAVILGPVDYPYTKEALVTKTSGADVICVR
jgi:hypothetical protein